MLLIAHAPLCIMSSAEEETGSVVDLTLSGDEEEFAVVPTPKSDGGKLYGFGRYGKSLRKRDPIANFKQEEDSNNYDELSVVTPLKKKVQKKSRKSDVPGIRKKFNDELHIGELTGIQRQPGADVDLDHRKSNNQKQKALSESPSEHEESSDDDSSHFSDGEPGKTPDDDNCNKVKEMVVTTLNQDSSSDDESLFSNESSKEETGTNVSDVAKPNNTNQNEEEASDDESLFSAEEESPVPSNANQNEDQESDDESLFPDEDESPVPSNATQNDNQESDDESLFPSDGESPLPSNAKQNEDQESDDESLFGSEEELHVGIDGNNDVRVVSSDGEHNAQPVPKKKPKKKRPGTLVTAEHHPMVLQEDKDVSYFTLKWGQYMIMKKTYFANGPPSKTFAIDDRIYEIFFFELITRKSGNGFSEDNMGRKYFKSYYRLQMPGVNLSSELLKIAAFDILTIKGGPQKTASRFKLLANTACYAPGSKEPCMHALETDMFEIIDDNGHLGCGFVPIDFLHEDILGNSAGACRAMAIQVRIVSPSMIGVAKGMLFAKKGIDKIQIPTSMIKVGKSTRNKVLHTDVVLIVKQIFPSKNNDTMQRMINPNHCNNDSRHPPTENQMKELKPLQYMANTVLVAKGCPRETIDEYVGENMLEHATLVGVCDPTGCIPEGHVFLTGFGRELPHEVFVTVTPSGEASDGIVVPVADATNLPAHAKFFLENLSFGAIVFALGDEETLIPPKMDDGDLDGDLYVVLWHGGIISMLQDTVESSPFEGLPPDDVVGIEFQTECDGFLYDAIVVEKLDEDLYLVETGEKMKTKVEMTKEQIYKGTLLLSKVTGHRLGENSRPTEFQFEWTGGKQEWVTLRNVREMFPDSSGPPMVLLEYAQKNELLKDGGPKDCKWLKKFLGPSELVKITNHRVNRKGIQLLCLYDDGDSSWEPMKDVKKDGKLQLAEYARDNNLFKMKGWKKTRDYWLKAVQDFYCNENIANEVTNLKSHLHGKFRASNEEYGPNDDRTRIWVRAYKEALKIEKHGGKVKLPLAYYREVKQSLKHLVDIVQ